VTPFFLFTYCNCYDRVKSKIFLTLYDMANLALDLAKFLE